MTVSCGPTNWNMVVNMTNLRAMYPQATVAEMYLSNSKCMGTVFSDTLVFNQSYTDCGSRKEVYDPFLSSCLDTCCVDIFIN